MPPISPVASRSSGMCATPARAISAAGRLVIVLPSMRMAPSVGEPESGDDLGQLALPIAGDAGDAERFARADLQIDIPQRRQSFFAERADAAQLQDGLPGRHGLMRFVGWMLDELGQLAADHQPRQRAAVGFSGRGRRDDLTPAQDADAIGDLQHLVELVRDEDDAEALRRHAAQRLQADSAPPAA